MSKGQKWFVAVFLAVALLLLMAVFAVLNQGALQP